MESTLTQNEKVFITIGLSIVAAFLVIFSKLNKKPTDLSQYATSEVINYQMARAEEGFAGYSLDGREVDEQYQGLQVKKETAQAKLLKSVPKPSAKVTTAKMAVPVKTPIATLQDTKVSVSRSIESDISQSTSKSENSPAIASSSAQSAIAPQNRTNSVAQNADVVNATLNQRATEKNKTKKAYSQWRQEILAQPSKEVIAEFIAAFRRNELTATEYQAMAQELVEQKDVTVKGLGLMALRSQPSMASLSQLVHAQETIAAPLQAYIEQAYLAYVQPQNIQFLNQALQTQDRKIILKSLSLLSVNIPKIKSGDASFLVDSRHLRATASNDLTLGSFQQLLPSLHLIGSAQVPEISPLAVQVASMIKSAQVAGL